MNDVQILSSLQTATTKIESFKTELESINNYINIFKTELEELRQKPNIPEQFESFKRATESFVEDLIAKQTMSKTHVDALRSSIETLKNTIHHHTDMIRQIKDYMPIMDQKITDTKDDVKEKIVSIATAFSNRFDSHAAQQKKELEMFSAHALTAPKSVLESNKNILEKLEVATLDASNAMLKVDNLVLSLRLLERKLEHLTLQVKKNELTQQA